MPKRSFGENKTKFIMELTAILATTPSGGIGKDGKLLFRDKQDMKLFRAKTMNTVVVAGRKTFEETGVLKGRINIVVSSSIKNAPFGDDKKEIYVSSINDAIRCIRANKQQFKASLGVEKLKVFVIGGQSIYEQLFSRCRYVYHSRFLKECDYDRSVDIPSYFDKKYCDTTYDNFDFIIYKNQNHK